MCKGLTTSVSGSVQTCTLCCPKNSMMGEYYDIAETADKIFIGSDFPDEFSHSNDTKRLKGANFGIPVYDEKGDLERYNIFSTRMLVRCDGDGKFYLYDLVRTKKETREPHEQ